jgi:hypothetical protein
VTAIPPPGSREFSFLGLLASSGVVERRRAIAVVVVAALVGATLGCAPTAALAAKPAPPIVEAVADPHGGYWQVGADGGVFAYDGAKFYGSLPDERIKSGTIVGMCANEDGNGYWLLSSTGKVYPFGQAPKLGDGGPGAAAIVSDGAGYRVVYPHGKSVAFLPPVPFSTPPASLMPKSIFNSNVPSWAVDPSSSALVANLVAQYQGAYGQVGVNTNRPVYEVPAGQAMVPVTVQSGCKDFTADTGKKAPIPQYAKPGNSTDNILTIYQPSTERAWEFWEAADTDGSWSACWGGKLDMATSNGVFPYPFGETASGISNLATEITEADVASGSINHAIAFQVLGYECDWSGTSKYGGLYPADRTDCGQDISGAPAEGQWFRFAPGTQMPAGLTPFGQMVFKAILSYGMVALDMGGDVAIEADMNGYVDGTTTVEGPWEEEGNPVSTDPINNATGTTPSYELVANLPWSDLQAVDPPGH